MTTLGSATLLASTPRLQFIESLRNDESKHNHRNYPLKRVLRTLNCHDTDDIPKAPLAGQVITEDGITYQMMHNGIKIIKGCYYGQQSEWMTDIIRGLLGHHEPQEERVFYEILKHIPSHAVMLELGSYWAYYSLWFAKSTPNAQNFLIEPCEKYLEIGKANFHLNKQHGTFIQAYVGLPCDRSISYKNVPKIGIDTFLRQSNIERLHILHSDIQGAELEMLQSATQAIKEHKIDYCIISTHSDLLHKQCLKFLVNHGYVVIAEHNVTQSGSADGLIAVRRKEIAYPHKVDISKY